jgi:hypothetical protein
MKYNMMNAMTRKIANHSRNKTRSETGRKVNDEGNSDEAADTVRLPIS